MNRTIINRNQISLILAAVTAGIITFLLCRQFGMYEETLAQQRLASEVMRIHVLAHSDGKEDQQLKLKVRDQILMYLQENMPRSEEKATSLWIRKHTDDIQNIGQECVENEGYDYPVNAAVTTCWFSDRAYEYGDHKALLFPEGNYEALRVEIGLGKGHNWWGILYPDLGFMHTTRAVVKDFETEEEGTEITATTTFKIRSYFLDKIKK